MFLLFPMQRYGHIVSRMLHKDEAFVKGNPFAEEDAKCYIFVKSVFWVVVISGKLHNFALRKNI